MQAPTSLHCPTCGLPPIATLRWAESQGVCQTCGGDWNAPVRSGRTVFGAVAGRVGTLLGSLISVVRFTFRCVLAVVRGAIFVAASALLIAAIAVQFVAGRTLGFVATLLFRLAGKPASAVRAKQILRLGKPKPRHAGGCPVCGVTPEWVRSPARRRR